MPNPYKPLEKALGYRFRRKRLLALALTHRSYRYETHGVEEDNQRLEFLGDAALGLAAAEYLFEKRPDAQEGDLTQYRSLATSTAALAEAAARINAGTALQLGKGERESGGAARESTLADTLEAMLGAAYLDGGMKAVRNIFRQLFQAKLDAGTGALKEANPKGHLQERCQARLGQSPRYALLEVAGPAHERKYRVEVRLGDRVLGTGEGLGRRAAETAAAQAALSDQRWEP